MSNYNPEIHHRKSIRLKGYDYTRPGYYFVTINLDNIRCMLAVWKNGKLELLLPGRMVERYWREISCHYPDVKIDEYVIMPDHMHGILKIDDTGTVCKGVQLKTSPPLHRKDVQLNVPTNAITTANANPDPYFAQLTPQGGSLSVIIRNFKSTVKRWCNENGYSQFKWQGRFYDHIVRNDEELNRIRHYIRNNPIAILKKFPGLCG